ncbi:trypsin alpha-3-like [Sitophilus oryzae]|uniref:Trypsin alpha-3-like n=1 Tax=Sitophilus oryzae TaxID=7048 RepID=A0A6J2X7I5_SITOR|nr:trypsin alpha-3-like [Sitophilus oryzae]
MGDGISAVACFSMTTLLVVSLANLILLVFMIMESRKKCGEDFNDRIFKSSALQSKFSSLVDAKNHRETPKFMAALVLLKSGTMVLICGTVIISRFWVLTSARCCETVKIYPFERLKIVSNADNWKKGKSHSVENLMRHANFSLKSFSHDVCLIKVGSPFKEIYETPGTLASFRYAYLQDTSATTIGWMTGKTQTSNRLYFTNVNLISFHRCQTLIKDERVDESMICAYNLENINCNFDSGGSLVQNNVIIGMASFESHCTNRNSPRVFTRISYFQKWIQLVENQNGVKIYANFKP